MDIPPSQASSKEPQRRSDGDANVLGNANTSANAAAASAALKSVIDAVQMHQTEAAMNNNSFTGGMMMFGGGGGGGAPAADTTTSDNSVEFRASEEEQQHLLAPTTMDEDRQAQPSGQASTAADIAPRAAATTAGDRINQALDRMAEQTFEREKLLQQAQSTMESQLNLVGGGGQVIAALPPPEELRTEPTADPQRAPAQPPAMSVTSRITASDNGSNAGMILPSALPSATATSATSAAETLQNLANQALQGAQMSEAAAADAGTSIEERILHSGQALHHGLVMSQIAATQAIAQQAAVSAAVEQALKLPSLGSYTNPGERSSEMPVSPVPSTRPDAAASAIGASHMSNLGGPANPFGPRAETAMGASFKSTNTGAASYPFANASLSRPPLFDDTYPPKTNSFKFENLPKLVLAAEKVRDEAFECVRAALEEEELAVAEMKRTEARASAEAVLCLREGASSADNPRAQAVGARYRITRMELSACRSVVTTSKAQTACMRSIAEAISGHVRTIRGLVEQQQGTVASEGPQLSESIELVPQTEEDGPLMPKAEDAASPEPTNNLAALLDLQNDVLIRIKSIEDLKVFLYAPQTRTALDRAKSARELVIRISRELEQATMRHQKSSVGTLDFSNGVATIPGADRFIIWYNNRPLRLVLTDTATISDVKQFLINELRFPSTVQLYNASSTKSDDLQRINDDVTVLPVDVAKKVFLSLKGDPPTVDLTQGVSHLPTMEIPAMFVASRRTPSPPISPGTVADASLSSSTSIAMSSTIVQITVRIVDARKVLVAEQFTEERRQWLNLRLPSEATFADVQAFLNTSTFPVQTPDEDRASITGGMGGDNHANLLGCALLRANDDSHHFHIVQLDPTAVVADALAQTEADEPSRAVLTVFVPARLRVAFHTIDSASDHGSLSIPVYVAHKALYTSTSGGNTAQQPLTGMTSAVSSDDLTRPTTLPPVTAVGQSLPVFHRKCRVKLLKEHLEARGRPLRTAFRMLRLGRGVQSELVDILNETDFVFPPPQAGEPGTVGSVGQQCKEMSVAVLYIPSSTVRFTVLREEKAPDDKSPHIVTSAEVLLDEKNRLFVVPHDRQQPANPGVDSAPARDDPDIHQRFAELQAGNNQGFPTWLRAHTLPGEEQIDLVELSTRLARIDTSSLASAGLKEPTTEVKATTVVGRITRCSWDQAANARKSQGSVTSAGGQSDDDASDNTEECAKPATLLKRAWPIALAFRLIHARYPFHSIAESQRSTRWDALLAANGFDAFQSINLADASRNFTTDTFEYISVKSGNTRLKLTTADQYYDIRISSLCELRHLSVPVVRLIQSAVSTWTPSRDRKSFTLAHQIAYIYPTTPSTRIRKRGLAQAVTHTLFPMGGFVLINIKTESIARIIGTAVDAQQLGNDQTSIILPMRYLRREAPSALSSGSEPCETPSMPKSLVLWSWDSAPNVKVLRPTLRLGSQSHVFVITVAEAEEDSSWSHLALNLAKTKSLRTTYLALGSPRSIGEISAFPSLRVSGICRRTPLQLAIDLGWASVVMAMMLEQGMHESVADGDSQNLWFTSMDAHDAEISNAIRRAVGFPRLSIPSGPREEREPLELACYAAPDVTKWTMVGKQVLHIGTTHMIQLGLVETAYSRDADVIESGSGADADTSVSADSDARKFLVRRGGQNPILSLPTPYVYPDEDWTVYFCHGKSGLIQSTASPDGGSAAATSDPTAESAAAATSTNTSLFVAPNALGAFVFVETATRRVFFIKELIDPAVASVGAKEDVDASASSPLAATFSTLILPPEGPYDKNLVARERLPLWHDYPVSELLLLDDRTMKALPAGFTRFLTRERADLVFGASFPFGALSMVVTRGTSSGGNGAAEEVLVPFLPRPALWTSSHPEEHAESAGTEAEQTTARQVLKILLHARTKRLAHPFGPHSSRGHSRTDSYSIGQSFAISSPTNVSTLFNLVDGGGQTQSQQTEVPPALADFPLTIHHLALCLQCGLLHRLPTLLGDPTFALSSLNANTLSYIHKKLLQHPENRARWRTQPALGPDVLPFAQGAPPVDVYQQNIPLFTWAVIYEDFDLFAKLLVALSPKSFDLELGVSTQLTPLHIGAMYDLLTEPSDKGDRILRPSFKQYIKLIGGSVDVRVSLEATGNLNLLTETGQTPLMLASEALHLKSVRALVDEHGADATKQCTVYISPGIVCMSPYDMILCHLSALRTEARRIEIEEEEAEKEKGNFITALAHAKVQQVVDTSISRVFAKKKRARELHAVLLHLEKNEEIVSTLEKPVGWWGLMTLSERVMHFFFLCLVVIGTAYVASSLFSSELKVGKTIAKNQIMYCHGVTDLASLSCTTAAHVQSFYECGIYNRTASIDPSNYTAPYMLLEHTNNTDSARRLYEQQFKYVQVVVPNTRGHYSLNCSSALAARTNETICGQELAVMVFSTMTIVCDKLNPGAPQVTILSNAMPRFPLLAWPVVWLLLSCFGLLITLWAFMERLLLHRRQFRLVPLTRTEVFQEALLYFIRIVIIGFSLALGVTHLRAYNALQDEQLLLRETIDQIEGYFGEWRRLQDVASVMIMPFLVTGVQIFLYNRLFGPSIVAFFNAIVAKAMIIHTCVFLVTLGTLALYIYMLIEAEFKVAMFRASIVNMILGSFYDELKSESDVVIAAMVIFTSYFASKMVLNFWVSVVWVTYKPDEAELSLVAQMRQAYFDKLRKRVKQQLV